MNPAAQLAIIKQMSSHELCGPAGDYQADEHARILPLSWRYQAAEQALIL